MPCCTVKDTRYTLGHIEQASLKELNSVRLEMNTHILRGDIPKACSGCGLAKRVAGQSAPIDSLSPQRPNKRTYRLYISHPSVQLNILF